MGREVKGRHHRRRADRQVGWRFTVRGVLFIITPRDHDDALTEEFDLAAIRATAAGFLAHLCPEPWASMTGDQILTLLDEGPEREALIMLNAALDGEQRLYGAASMERFEVTR